MKLLAFLQKQVICVEMQSDLLHKAVTKTVKKIIIWTLTTKKSGTSIHSIKCSPYLTVPNMRNLYDPKKENIPNIK